MLDSMDVEDSLFPAYVGVILVRGSTCRSECPFPRIRGGDPRRLRRFFLIIFFSPHTQGRSITKTPLAAIRYTSQEGVHTYASPNGANFFTISDLFQLVKDNKSNFNPKNSSKVVNENGEPLVVERDFSPYTQEVSRCAVGNPRNMPSLSSHIQGDILDAH